MVRNDQAVMRHSLVSLVTPSGGSIPANNLHLPSPDLRRPQGMCFLMLINDAMMDIAHHWKYGDDSKMRSVIISSIHYSDTRSSPNDFPSWTSNNHVTVMMFDAATTPSSPPALTLCDL